MKYAQTIRKLQNQPVAILPDHHRAILETAHEVIAGEYDPKELFEVEPVYQQVGGVAIINICGTILPTCSKLEKMLGAVSCKEIRVAVQRSQQDADIKAVIFNIESGGGVVQGVPETGEAIKALSAIKPTMTYTGECMASAAYWLGAQAGSIIASPSAMIGSIGVYLSVLTMEKSLALEGVEVTILRAGKYKTLGISAKDLTAEEKEDLQEGVDKTYADFVAAVSHRGLATETMQGEVYDAIEAANLKLIDGTQTDLADIVNHFNAAI